MKILVMGLPGSGKSTLSHKIYNSVSKSVWLNADKVRSTYNDWDFSYEGRIRQATRMKALCIDSTNYIIDMVCPLPEMRKILNPDFIIWMDTIREGRYDDTNNIFVHPETYNIRISFFNYNINQIISEINKFLESDK